MRREDRADNEASLSFLDVIACAFGAIVLLVLILPIAETGNPETGAGIGDYGALLLRLVERETTIRNLDADLGTTETRVAALDKLLSAQDISSNALQELLDSTRADAAAIQRRIAAAQRALAKEAAAVPQANPLRPTERAGIPVDAEYVAIVIDTSQSMRGIWAEVVGEVGHVLSIYPEIRGFQILNANGQYIWKPGTWITDSGGNRRVARTKLDTWSAYSASNPEQGILTAIRDLYRPAINMAVFVFGDDYVGTDYENFLATVQSGVARHSNRGGTLRIHAFGFHSPYVDPPQRTKYATLMRELTRRHEGAFLALSH